MVNKYKQNAEDVMALIEESLVRFVHRSRKKKKEFLFPIKSISFFQFSKKILLDARS